MAKVNPIIFKTKLINKTLKIHAVYNPAINELRFFKNGIEIDCRDMTGYTEEQLEHYLEGVIKGLKEL